MLKSPWGCHPMGCFGAQVITRYLFVFGSGSCPDVLASVLAPKCEQLARQDWTANPPVPEPHSAQSNPTPSLPQAGQASGAARTLSAPSNTVQGSTAAAATVGASHTAAGPASSAGAAPGQHSNLMAMAQTLPSWPGWSGSTANLPVRAPQPPVPTPAPAAAWSAAAAAATARLAASAPAPTLGPPQLIDLSSEAGATQPGTPVLSPAPGTGVVTRSRSSLRPAGPAVATGTVCSQALYLALNPMCWHPSPVCWLPACMAAACRAACPVCQQAVQGLDTGPVAELGGTASA